jgi:preprotein translocase subunit SecD
MNRAFTADIVAEQMHAVLSRKPKLDGVAIILGYVPARQLLFWMLEQRGRRRTLTGTPEKETGLVLPCEPYKPHERTQTTVRVDRFVGPVPRDTRMVTNELLVTLGNRLHAVVNKSVKEQRAEAHRIVADLSAALKTEAQKQKRARYLAKRAARTAADAVENTEAPQESK